MNTLQYIINWLQSPQTPTGKSLRDALLAGVATVLTVVADGNFGGWTPLITSMAMFGLSQLNRLTR